MVLATPLVRDRLQIVHIIRQQVFVMIGYNICLVTDSKSFCMRFGGLPNGLWCEAEVSCS